MSVGKAPKLVISFGGSYGTTGAPPSLPSIPRTQLKYRGHRKAGSITGSSAASSSSSSSTVSSSSETEGESMRDEDHEVRKSHTGWFTYFKLFISL
ncbi:unnamed protein product [Protopolystoma xenopodis]|uniref:Uncharacterized protein n=1 Tax=Protopolystoma xenopodis TaxID=117903 RepID=A0A3S5CLN5_9PLAT|nr:unnamed protein product [Protopolystoma xenopodis]